MVTPPRLLFVLLIALLLFGVLPLLALAQEPAQAPAMTRSEYANLCAERMGEIPTFNCLNGEVIPITVNGVVQSELVDQCDKPDQLNGRCVPFSRLLELDTGHNNITTLAICRKYHDNAADYEFQDIAVIQHNRVTGDTCWFQSPTNVNHDGRTVPSPMSASNQASAYWYEPAHVSGINCQQCHAADPFIWTPYIGQVVEQYPPNWNPKGIYTANLFDIFADDQPSVFEPVGNQCTSCHRIGNTSSSHDFVRRSIAMPAHPADLDGDRWMPPVGHSLDPAAIDQLERCFADPTRAECNTYVPAGIPCYGTLHINAAYNGAEQGSAAQPFRTIAAAYAYACQGAQLHIQAGSYPETLTLSKRIELHSTGGVATIGD